MVQPGVLNPSLSWTHYRTLLKEERQPVRDFYEIESVRNGWSARQLGAADAFFLFERLPRAATSRACWRWPTKGRR